MVQWLIHLKDGKTLTDDKITPHQVDVLATLGYSPDDITSVERIVRGRHLSIAKSPFIDAFFVGTEEGIDMKMGGRHQAPAEVTKRILGCYVKDTEPPLQARLIMDPRTFNTELRFPRVRKKTLKGINTKLVNPKKKGTIEKSYRKEIVGNTYSIVETSDIKRYFNTPTGFGCVLRDPPIRAELVIRSQNVLLGFTSPDQKLKTEF